MHHQMHPEHALECTEKGSATATESTRQRNTYREGKSACARQGVRQSEETRILNIPNLGSFSDKLLEQDDAFEWNKSIFDGSSDSRGK
jgi:hypothetical protein